MCRSIRQLRRAPDDGPATTGEARAAALQYVRKVSGLRTPPARHRVAFDAAVEEVAAATARLLEAVGTDVAEGPDPFADPAARRAILEAAAARQGGAAARRGVRGGRKPVTPGRLEGDAPVPVPDGSTLAERSGGAAGAGSGASPAAADRSARLERPRTDSLAAPVAQGRPRERPA